MSVRTHSEQPSEMVAPLVAGLCVAATALAGRYGIQAWQAFKARPPRPRIRRFYEGGFQPTMTKREAALILGVRSAHQGTSLIYKWNKEREESILRLRSLCGCGKHMEVEKPVLFVSMWESTATEKVKEAHRKVMIANHPDAGGSHYLASKINEAKDMLLGKSKNSGSVF
ncbi:hypothetical protein Cgig2_017055 [Carnegiea gigantea]|uniref:Mitochondrial import inner membrane translocase subunit TIM14 n=1 Tax=Carnegiea gigantea TaxID=171969 RepID=A0A9Q1GQA7_9CARY|nr:hypothetical protein Cgig2_017055 [Carnegiea gigantea]